MYNESVRLNSGNPNYLLKYFDNNIKKIYIIHNQYEKITGDLACIDYDVLWQAQDLDTKAKLTFTQPSKDRVKVKIGATAGIKEQSVTYQVECNQGNSCKITEIFEKGKPFTKEVTKCLDEFYHTQIKKH